MVRTLPSRPCAGIRSGAAYRDVAAGDRTAPLSRAAAPAGSGPRRRRRRSRPANDDFRRYASLLDAALDGRQWLLGERLSYADFRVATALPFAEAIGLPLDRFAQLRRWHERLLAIDAWRAPFEGLPQG